MLKCAVPFRDRNRRERMSAQGVGRSSANRVRTGRCAGRPQQHLKVTRSRSTFVERGKVAQDRANKDHLDSAFLSPCQG